ncbi:hypothetical protein C4546_02695 [Candidatus Parcubacteria bacterium]|jgi:photosystem II stability/assembly factor-like uncharacterized protein|nr:MAG: hypothetical protein C4546_02695 [Candidatus Parcubacteria bacterium]
MKKILLPILALIFLSGCLIQFKTSSSGSGQGSGDGGVFTSTDRGETWQQKVFVSQEAQKVTTIGNTNVGFFYFHPIDPDLVYFSSIENGLWQTKNLGEAWSATALRSGYVTGFDIDPKNPDTMYAGFQNTVQKSVDAGVTWETIYTNQPGHTINQVRVDPFDSRDIFAATSGGVLLKSEDQGVTWRIIQQFSGKDLKRMQILKNDSRIMFLVTQNGILRSTDGGTSWNENMSQALAKINALPVNDFVYTERNPSTMYVASNLGLVRSTDGGTSWQVVPTVIPPSTVPIQAVAINSFDEKEIYFTAGSTFYKSQDEGATWQTLKNVPSGRLFKVLAAHPKKPGTLLLGTQLVKK